MKKIKVLQVIRIALFLAASPKIEAAEKLQEFKLSDVKILDGPFLNAQQVDLKYILALDQDRLLPPFLKDAGIKPLKDNYPNWETSGLNGHTGGHYLSAL